MADERIYLEITEIAKVLRVAAVDGASGEEVVFQAPSHTPRAELERLALAKLNRRLGRSDDEKKRPDRGSDRGIII
jgi:hypothetical protein